MAHRSFILNIHAAAVIVEWIWFYKYYLLELNNNNLLNIVKVKGLCPVLQNGGAPSASCRFSTPV